MINVLSPLNSVTTNYDFACTTKASIFGVNCSNETKIYVASECMNAAFSECI